MIIRVKRFSYSNNKEIERLVYRYFPNDQISDDFDVTLDYENEVNTQAFKYLISNWKNMIVREGIYKYDNRFGKTLSEYYDNIELSEIYSNDDEETFSMIFIPINDLENEYNEDHQWEVIVNNDDCFINDVIS